MAKRALIREVKSMSMACDPVGNLLLVKFAFHNGQDGGVFIPASIVFWLLDHIPVNQDRNPRQPPAPPRIVREDWNEVATPRALSVRCKQFKDALRMAFELDRKPGLTVLMDGANVELMRQIMVHYRDDLIDLAA